MGGGCWVGFFLVCCCFCVLLGFWGECFFRGVGVVRINISDTYIIVNQLPCVECVVK